MTNLKWKIETESDPRAVLYHSKVRDKIKRMLLRSIHSLYFLLIALSSFSTFACAENIPTTLTMANENSEMENGN